LASLPDSGYAGEISKSESNHCRVSEYQETRMQDIRVTGYQGKVREKKLLSLMS